MVNNKIKLKISPSMAVALFGVENEILNRLHGIKFVDGNENVKLVQRMIDFETLNVLDKLERIATAKTHERTLNLSFTQCVCFYYNLRQFPVNQADVFTTLAVNEMLAQMHQILFN